MALRPEVKIVAGRPARPGADEAIVGARIRGRIRGLDLEQSFNLKKNRPVKVVGIFDAGGSAYDSEVWVDRELLRQAYHREGVVSSVAVHPGVGHQVRRVPRDGDQVRTWNGRFPWMRYTPREHTVVVRIEQYCTWLNGILAPITLPQLIGEVQDA